MDKKNNNAKEPSKGNYNDKNSEKKFDNRKSNGKDYHKGNKNKPKNGKDYKSDKSAYNNDSVYEKRIPYDSVTSNDINWWNKSPMFDDVTRIPFNRIYGAPINIRNTDYMEVQGFTQKSTIPIAEIMRINYVPSVGGSGDGNSALNRSFNSLFGELYARTTGTPPIQQMDVAMFVTSLASVASLIAMLKRALGVSQLYSSLNYSYPKRLLSACGISPQSVIGQQDALRYKLNDCILNFNNLKVPDVMDIFVRQYALAHNVYTDEDDVMSHMYTFVPEGYYTYSDTATPARLVWHFLPDNVSAINLITNINTCLECWRNSSDLALISGTIQRAFADTQTITLDYVKEGDAVVPTVDRNIMWQINNSNCYPIDTSIPDNLDITQNVEGNYLQFAPLPNHSNSHLVACWASDDHMLNTFDGNTSPEFLMESTRLLSSYDAEEDSVIINTEFVTSYDIFYVYYEADGTQIETLKTFRNAIMLDEVADIRDYALLQCLVSQFKYHPIITNYYKGTGTKYHCVGQIGDLYKFTTVSSGALKGLYKCATQSVYRTFTAPKGLIKK